MSADLCTATMTAQPVPPPPPDVITLTMPRAVAGSLAVVIRHALDHPVLPVPFPHLDAIRNALTSVACLGAHRIINPYRR